VKLEGLAAQEPAVDRELPSRCQDLLDMRAPATAGIGATDMIVHVGAGKEIVLQVKAFGVPDGDPITLTVHKLADDAELGTLEGKVKDGQVECPWVAPELDEGEETRRVYYEAEVGEHEVSSHEIEIYRDKVTVASVDEEGKPFPDASYELAAGDEVRVGHTGAKGERVEDYLPPGKVRIAWLDPCELVGWEEEGGATWKAKLRPRFVDVDVLGDPEDHPSGTRYILCSDDGSYQQARSVREDRIPGDGKVTLRFTGLIPAETYSLVLETESGARRVIIDAMAYADMIDST